MFGFGKRFYAPIYVIALISFGMILIYISESFGLSHRKINLDLRNANNIILADKLIQKQVSSHDLLNNKLISTDESDIYFNDNLIKSCSSNCYSKKSSEIEDNQIKRINMILINSVA
jgi:hypothetical protein